VSRISARTLTSIAVIAAGALTACSVDGPPPANAYEAGVKADFIRDRDRCRAVAERALSYVNPRDGDAVADRSYRVEGEIQQGMLSRGWNNPEFDGWADGRY